MSPLPAIYSQIEPLLRWNHHCPHPMDGSPQCWPSLPSLSSYTDNPSCSAPSHDTQNITSLNLPLDLFSSTRLLRLAVNPAAVGTSCNSGKLFFSSLDFRALETSLSDI